MACVMPLTRAYGNNAVTPITRSYVLLRSNHYRHQFYHGTLLSDGDAIACELPFALKSNLPVRALRTASDTLGELHTIRLTV